MIAARLQSTLCNVFALAPQYFSPTLLYRFSKTAALIEYVETIISLSSEEREQHYNLLTSLEQYEIMGKNLPESVKVALGQNLEHVEPASGSILLTGARGFLGNYLLYELLVKSKSTIYCVVRSHGN